MSRRSQGKLAKLTPAERQDKAERNARRGRAHRSDWRTLREHRALERMADRRVRRMS